MADAGAGRHDAEVAEGLLAPLQEACSARSLRSYSELDVAGEGDRRAELVDDDGVVDDEVDRHQRVDLLRVAAQRHAMPSRMAARSTTARNAGEVLHQHAGRAIGDLDAGLCPCRSSQPATAWIASLVTERPSSLRSRFSSSTFIE